MGTLTLDQYGGLHSMTLHDLFTLLNLPIGTSGHDMTKPLPEINIGVQYIRYSNESILKLQIHQHILSKHQ